MKIALLLVAACLTPAVCVADTLPFGQASAYNLVALGTVNSSGNTVIAGTIATNADIGGRIAAADQVLIGTTIGSGLNSDPWGAAATYGMVSTNGLAAGQIFNINGGGNVFAPGSNSTINFNDGGMRVTSGSSGLDFSTMRSTLQLQSATLALLTPNGIVGAPTPPGANPSWLILEGTNSTLNVFNITAAQFADANHNIDIVAPAGSTIIVNVSGTNITLGAGLYYNGVQVSGDNAADQNILFNFSEAQTVAIDAQFNASALAPYAVLTGNGQMSGNFIAAQIGQTGEIHNVKFTGTLPDPPSGPPTVPEPGTFALMGTGILSLAMRLRSRMTA
jgi:choice-of-anchor A domain-containing protein